MLDFNCCGAGFDPEIAGLKNAMVFDESNDSTNPVEGLRQLALQGYLLL